MNRPASVVEGSKAELLVSGLRYHADYLAVREEQTLMAWVNAQPWRTDLRRRVQHYGYTYDYKARKLDASMALGPLPELLAGLAKRIAEITGTSSVPDQVIVNEYLPGQGIAPHIDCVPCFGDPIASLSLGSTCTMDLIPDTGDRVALLLLPRSLLILSGDARYSWKHSIAARKTDPLPDGGVGKRGRRVSLTFRRANFS